MSVLDDLLTLCEQTMEVCHGHTNKDDPHYRFGYVLPQCLKPPTHVIRWSDRVSYACDEHVDCIKGYAARDSSGDRTDAPYIDSFSNGEIIFRYWDNLVARREALMSSETVHRLCMPPANASDVRRWTGKRWVKDDGKPGLAFSGVAHYTKENGRDSTYPAAWATECKAGCSMTCVKWRAMTYTANRFGAANGDTVTPCNKEK